jgi:DNA-binding response OmpR family regulator
MTYQETSPRLLAIGWSDEEMDLFTQLQQMGIGISPVTSKQAALKSLLTEDCYSGLMINADTDLFDAYLLCRIMRAASPMPIVMVAANGQRLNPSKAADAGADDWALLPISSREFAARMLAKMRRHQNLQGFSSQALHTLNVMMH